ncbi:hypothetical protein [Pontibacter sp. SGAir0037]|uniref:hypothetical protein n=1 Tax=Pontibacter sp. SGAir0037 TaxID=2571030 RepID=UPI0010CCB851|nr:hypothetical protein [Pontibacter sp. SGAir0037]QCR23872.1 hypothetical protein C1N53_16975 [Pontibacter sp. SGAir0037]
MKKSWLIVCVLVAVAFRSEAQVYRTAAGIRLDSDQFGITIQQRVQERSTVEGILSMSSNEFRGTALYEWHRPLLGRRFNYYMGAGGHVGNLKDNGTFTGLDVIGGIEYKVNGLPFLLSADIQPAVHFNHENWTDFSTGVSIRYVILPEKKKKKSLWPFGKKEETSKNSKASQEEENIFQKIFKKKED